MTRYFVPSCDFGCAAAPWRSCGGVVEELWRSCGGVVEESGIYQVGVLLQDAEELGGRAVRGADALFPVPDGG